MVRLSWLTLLHASSEDVQKKIKIGYAKVFQQGLTGLLPAVEAAALAQRADGVREGMVHLRLILFGTQLRNSYTVAA